MSSYRNRVTQGLKSVVIWWFLSAYVSGIVGVAALGKNAAILNIVATSVFSVFLVIGVLIGAKGPLENNSINLGSPKIEPSIATEEVTPVVSSLRPYSAFIEAQDRHGTIVIIAKDKENAKRRIIEKFPDCKIMYFDDWLRDGNYIIRGELDD